MSREAGPGRSKARADREFLNDAILLAAQTAATSRGGPEADMEIPEDVLGILDGTATREDADRAMRLLSEDPALARAFGQLAETIRKVPAEIEGEGPAPASAAATRSRPEPRPAGILDALRDMFSGPRTPLLAASAAAVLLVTIAILNSERTSDPAPTYRKAPHGPSVVSRTSPEDGVTLRGDVLFEWIAAVGATDYRVVLIDPGSGLMLDLGPTAETTLTADGSAIGKVFPGSGTRELLWSVRARKLDGTEASSAPGEFLWESANR